MQMSQAAGTEQMIPRLSRYSSESGRKLNSWLIIKLINIVPYSMHWEHLALVYLKSSVSDPDWFRIQPVDLDPGGRK